MSANVEIKARVRDAERFAATASGLCGAEPELIRQSDVFFPAAAGRLKLRRFDAARGELIHYERPDAAGPKTSCYRLVPTADPDGLAAALSDALGELGRVDKVRRLWLAGRTRIHLDAVEGLGDFMELEVVLAEGEDPRIGEAEARDLMRRLGIVPEDLVEGAYLDLLRGGAVSSFYSAFAARYEQVFPVREPVVRALLALSAPGDRVLDLGCGPGHHCARLAAAGRRTVGVDLDPAMIDTARTAHPEVDARVLDLRDAPGLDGPWGLVWCIGNVASHLPAEALAGILAGLAAKMPSGAGLLVQTVDWDALADRGTYRFPDLALDDGVVFRREYLRRDDGAVRFLTRLEERGAALFDGEALLHPTDAAAWRALLAGAGFDVVSHAADFLGAPFPTPRTPGGSVWTARRR